MTVILDALIIGSGALGCATAYYLTEAGIRRVGVVDRGPLVSGMTRRSAGLVHTHHVDAVTARLAQQSLDIFRHWAGSIGGSCGYVETGALITVGSEQGAVSLRSRVELHRQMGIDTQWIEENEWAGLFPRVSFQGVSGVAFEAASGYVDSVVASQGFARRARENGARFDTGTLVRQIDQQRGQVTEVLTTTGSIQSPVVILTAGAGAERLIARLGTTLDLRGVRGAIGFFEQPQSLAEMHPAILDLDSSSFVRPHSFHLTAVGIVEPTSRVKAAESWDDSLTPGELSALSLRAARRLPLLESAPLKRAHAILYDQMPDGLPVLGPVPGTGGLYVAAGFGQNAVATAPAVGRAISEMVVDGRANLDLEEFRLERHSITHVV